MGTRHVQRESTLQSKKKKPKKITRFPGWLEKGSTQRASFTPTVQVDGTVHFQPTTRFTHTDSTLSACTQHLHRWQWHWTPAAGERCYKRDGASSPVPTIRVAITDGTGMANRASCSSNSPVCQERSTYHRAEEGTKQSNTSLDCEKGAVKGSRGTTEQEKSLQVLEQERAREMLLHPPCVLFLLVPNPSCNHHSACLCLRHDH